MAISSNSIESRLFISPICSDMKFEDLVSELQSQINNSILCIKNGSCLIIFTKREDFPPGLNFISAEMSQRGIKVFYFKSEDKDIYAVFGVDAANIFCPKIRTKGKVVGKINYSGLISNSISRVGFKAELEEKKYSPNED